MALCRLYQLENSRLAGSDEVEAADDDAAAALAAARPGPGLIEIWHGHRRVRTVAPTGNVSG